MHYQRGFVHREGVKLFTWKDFALAARHSGEDFEVLRGGDDFRFVGWGDDTERRGVGERAFTIEVEEQLLEALCALIVADSLSPGVCG